MRRLLNKVKAALAPPVGWAATVPFRFTGPEELEPPPSVCHSRWPATLRERFNRPGMRILEIGSRNVTGANFRSSFSAAHYVGFDLYPVENVDVVGDAHRLSIYFAPQERFDLIFSSAVFEHLYMPWVAVEQIAKLLKVTAALMRRVECRQQRIANREVRESLRQLRELLGPARQSV